MAAEHTSNVLALNDLIDKIDTLNTKIDQLITLLGAGLPSALTTDRLKVSTL